MSAERDTLIPKAPSRPHSAPAYLDAGLHLAALSIVAGCVHAVVAAPHFAEYWLFGGLFVGLATFQLGWGAWVYQRPSALVFRVGLVLNLGVVAVWLASRTAGLPVGPEAGTPEALGPLDPAATAVEAMIALLCVAFLRSGGRAPSASELGLPVRIARATALLLMSGTLLLLVLGAGHHYQD
jgi:hypothetical protein